MTRAWPFPIVALPLLVVLSACGTDVSGPSGSLLSCVLAEPASVAPGGVVQVRGEEARSVCLTPQGSESGLFAYVPFFAAPAPDGDEPEVTLEVDIGGGGFISPSAAQAGAALAAPARPVLLGSGATAAAGGRPALDWGFHTRLRQRELRELGPLIGGRGSGLGPGESRSAASAPAGALAVPEVGDLVDLNIEIDCLVPVFRTGEVKYVSDHAVVVADTANPEELTSDDYAYFGITFDTLIYPVETEHFGTPTDIDANGRSILFFTTAVNQRNSQDAESVVLGFFWSGDLFPEVATSRLNACPAANQAEMFYLIAPDPGGVAGRAFTLDEVRELAIPLIGHEYQHLINASRRLYVNEASELEDVWLNEGLSHIAEELLFYEASGLAPLQNLTIEELRNTPGAIDAFNEYMGGNFANFSLYLTNPDTASLMAIDHLATRGASWAFLRYAADRTAGDDAAFFFDVVNSQIAGLDNLDEVLPAHPLDWMRDWTVSVYGDDFVPGLAERFHLRSWNLRNLYTASSIGSYPLRVRTLQSGDTDRVELDAGGAMFTRFGVPAGERAVVSTESESGPPPSTFRGSFIRQW